MNYKRCHNCKYIKYEYYDDSKCKAPSTFSVLYDGVYKKNYNYCKNIRPKNVDEECKYFKSDFIFKIKQNKLYLY